MYRFKIVDYSNRMILMSGVSDTLDYIFDKVEEIISKSSEGLNVYVMVEKKK